MVLGRRRRLCADLAIEAVTLTAFVLAGNTLLRPLVNAINRAPLDERATEAVYEVRLTAAAGERDEARDLLEAQLEAANYPVREIDVAEREPDAVEIIATLVATAADPRELDAVVAALAKAPLVRHASWTARPSE